MTNKEITNKKKEIERLIHNEQNKIKLAEENKKSFQLRQASSNAKKPKPITSTKPSYKMEETKKTVFQQPKMEPVAKTDVAKTQPSLTEENNEEKGVGKIFYIVAIAAGVVLIAAIVVLMIGIVSGWSFWL